MMCATRDNGDEKTIRKNAMRTSEHYAINIRTFQRKPPMFTTKTSALSNRKYGGFLLDVPERELSVIEDGLFVRRDVDALWRVAADATSGKVVENRARLMLQDAAGMIETTGDVGGGIRDNRMDAQ